MFIHTVQPGDTLINNCKKSDGGSLAWLLPFRSLAINPGI